MPVPSEPVYGYEDNNTGARGPRLAANANGGNPDSAVQRGGLAPVGDVQSSRAFGQSQPERNGGTLPRYASSDAAPIAGASFAMQPVDAHGAGGAPYAAKPSYQSAKRYAGPARGEYDGSGAAYQPRYDDYKPYRAERREERREPYERVGAGDERDYIVREGDTLFSIAQRHGLSIGQLAELNALNGATIHPGQRLRVRGGGGHEYTATNKYKPSRDYEPRHAERETEDNSEDERKAPPPRKSAYREDDRYGSYEGYNKAPAGYDDKDEDRREPPYAERDEKRYDEKRYEAAPRPPYAEKPWRAEKSEPRQASRYDEPRDAGREERYAPRAVKPKGSYYAYSVKPGETLLDVARRGGLSPRQLADYNDIPHSAPLYPGQVLHIPKGRVDEGRGRDEAEERESYDERDRRTPPRGYEREGQAPRSPHSQNTPEKAQPKAPANQQAPGGGERRFAKAEDRPSLTANDAESGPQAANGSQPMLAAHRDLGADEAPAGPQQQAGASDCESLLANPAARSSESFREPVQGVITAKFGARDDGSFNDGIDFSVPKGTAVKAAENGVVAYAGSELPGFGNLVLIRHADGFVTAYAHNDEILVRRCEVVKRGQTVSKAGATGKVSQPQLHFELRKDSKPVDPEGYFSRS